MALVTTNNKFPAIFSTRITNVSGAAMFLGYLGKHGTTLADGDTYVEEGDLIAKLSGHNGAAQRLRNALATNLQAGDVTIQQTPISIDEDIVAAAPAGGTLIGAYNATVALTPLNKTNASTDYAVPT